MTKIVAAPHNQLNKKPQLLQAIDHKILKFRGFSWTVSGQLDFA